MNLPESFLCNMKSLLGGEFDAFLSSYNDDAKKGLRTNRLKLSSDGFFEISPFKLSKIPYIDNGFIYNNENPAKDSYYHAGLYYLQEPSAMLPANRLPVCPGDKVLDMCAAPGGKATEISGKLNNTGILYANDISASRAYALLKNLELTGAKNYYVTAESPENLAARLPEFFDKILCDVPCSGEGMFRKEPSLISSYIASEKDGFDYQEVQRDILDNAYKLLKPGGLLMYSTCTFNTHENEENISWFIDKYSDMELTDIEGYDGFSEGYAGLSKCVRVFPHKMDGEGHFLALLKKTAVDTCDTGENACRGNVCPDMDCPDNVFDDNVCFDNWNQGIGNQKLNVSGAAPRELRIKNSVFRLPALDDNDNGYRKGLRYIRTGLYIGDEAKDKSGGITVNYSQAYAMTLKHGDFENSLDLLHDDIRVNKYLKGETVFPDDNGNIKKGYTLITVDGFPLGFAKFDGSRLKNMYNPSWRMN